MKQNLGLFLLALQCKLLFVTATVRNGFRTKTILTVPHKPIPLHALYKLCHRLGYIITDDAACEADVVIHWEDCTVRTPCQSLDILIKARRVINYRCRDISKRHVAEVFANVFGYCLQVNPEEHHGFMVAKSEVNARHDGVIVHGPVANGRPGVAYQKLVNNVEAGYVVDIRVPVFGDFIPYCLVKRIPLAHRFTNREGYAVIQELSGVFTEGEIHSVKEFCCAMGLDYGELDVLRDSDDGKLYIVDVNNTPYGPLDRHIHVKPYFDRTSWIALGRMCWAFRTAFIEAGCMDVASA